MSEKSTTIFVVDDDEAIRDSLAVLLKTVDLNATTFSSGDEFLEAYDPGWEGCILLDIRMPGTSGMEVQKRLAESGCSIPIIFITGHGDIPMAVEAMHGGAFDFIQKPFRDQDLLDRIDQALTTSNEQEQQAARKKTVQNQLQTLTPREQEVMQLVVHGSANKVIAMDLGVSQRTVEIHRARVMEKMQARSLAELVRMALLIES
jgi:RNA polymerase sigma factor (sigma-70 family)